MLAIFVVPLITCVIGIATVYIIFQLRKILDDDQTKNQQSPNVQHLWKTNPINAADGWTFHSVYNGVTVWWKKERKPTMQNGIFGCQALVQACAEEVISQLLQPKILALTDISVDDIHIVPNHGSRLSKTGVSNESIDSLLVTEKTSVLPSPFTLKSFYISWKHSHKVLRLWSRTGADKHALVLAPDSHLYCYKFGLWTCFLVRELPGVTTSRLSLLTILTVPVSAESSHSTLLRNRIANQILCLREHIDSLYIATIIHADSTKPNNSTNAINQDSRNNVQHQKETEKDVNEKNKNYGTEEQPASIQHVAVTESEPPEEEPFVISKEVLKYWDFIQETFDKLYEIHLVNQDTPGWNYEGRNKGVDVYKMNGDSSCPWDCFKGTTDVQVPLAYAMQYCHDVKFKPEWDDLFHEGHVIKELDATTKITHLIYKAVWPTSGRDFVALSCTRHLKDTLYGTGLRTIDYPFPDMKGKVRGEIIIGGFLFEEISSSPPCTRVTYVTRADLKGQVPARLVNKVNSAQPLYTAVLRDKMEERLEAGDPVEDDQLLRTIKRIPSVFEQPRKERTPSPSASRKESANNPNQSPLAARSTSSGNIPVIVNKEETMTRSVSGDNVQNTGFDSLQISSAKKSDDNISVSSLCSSETQRGYSPSEFEDCPPLSDQDFDLPRDFRGNIDFQTLGNQTAASLLEEALLVSRVEHVEDKEGLIGEWTYQGVKRGVKMFRKIHKEEAIHSFLGTGEIDVIPTAIWEAITNPATRFIYDNMLKKTKVVKEIGKGYKIIHMKHETTACFVRQARDFVILTTERTEGNKYVLAGTSVDIPECPPDKECVRGRVLSSGWIIEPILKGRKSCSQVTYLSQVHFGGRLPVRLVNHIAKRQPLSIAYLRDYLEPAQK